MSVRSYDLEPADWHSLLAQAALLHAVAAELGDFHDMAHHPTTGKALSQLMEAAAAAGANSGGDEDAVRLARERWCADLAASRGTPGLNPGEDNLLGRLHSCAGEATAENPYATLFETVKHHCAGAYGDEWVDPEHRVTPLPAHPRKPADDYGVTALCLAQDRPCVEILVHRERLGPAAWAALPSVLVHECVCHVAARQRSKVKNGSAFAEGFMDWAATWFHSIWIVAIDDRLAPAARQHARQLADILMDPQDKEGAARRDGHRAADRLAAWVEKSVDWPSTAARAWVAQLAVALNSTDAPLALKDRLVAKLKRYKLDPKLDKRLRAVLKREAQPADLLL